MLVVRAEVTFMLHVAQGRGLTPSQYLLHCSPVVGWNMESNPPCTRESNRYALGRGKVSDSNYQCCPSDPCLRCEGLRWPRRLGFTPPPGLWAIPPQCLITLPGLCLSQNDQLVHILKAGVPLPRCLLKLSSLKLLQSAHHPTSRPPPKL